MILFMRKNGLFMGTIILTVASVTVRLIGFIFRVYLADKLGAVGMGIFQLIMSVYMLLATFATSGVSLAVSRLAAQEFAARRPNGAKRVLDRATMLMAITGISTSLILYFYADFIAHNIIKDESTILSLKILAPSLLFMAISSCHRGYFMAKGEVIKPALAQIIEQIARIAVTVLAIGAWAGRGLSYALAAVVLGATIGEVASWGFSYILYLFEKKPQKDAIKIDKITRKIIGISVPIAANSYMNNGFRMIENLLIPRGLGLFGYSSKVSMGMYGMLKGMVMPLLFFPSSFLTSLAITLVPSVAAAKSIGNSKRVNYTIAKVMKLTLLCGILIVSIFIAYSYELGLVIYKSKEVGEMVRQLSIVCPFLYLEMVVVGMLNGLGEQVTCMINNIVDWAIRLAIIYFVLPMFGFEVYIIAVILGCSLDTLLNVRKLIKVTSVVFNIRDWIIKPVFNAAVAIFSSKLVLKYIVSGIGQVESLILGILIIVFVYVVLSVKKGDVLWLKQSIKRK